jgi:hypothetical protein
VERTVSLDRQSAQRARKVITVLRDLQRPSGARLVTTVLQTRRPLQSARPVVIVLRPQQPLFRALLVFTVRLGPISVFSVPLGTSALRCPPNRQFAVREATVCKAQALVPTVQPVTIALKGPPLRSNVLQALTVRSKQVRVLCARLDTIVP